MESDRCDRKFGIATFESRISGESQVSVSAIISEWVSHSAALISVILFWILTTVGVYTSHCCVL